jgi:ankyrin repeat protein
MLAVDEGDFLVFRCLLEITYYHDQQVTDPLRRLLPGLMKAKCQSKKETCLLKASRLNQLEMVYSIVHLIIKEAVPFDVALYPDLSNKNVLHWAVINKQRDLVDVLVGKLDADKQGLRLQADCRQ